MPEIARLEMSNTIT